MKKLKVFQSKTIKTSEPEGWISLHRKILDNFLYPKNRPFTKYEAWIDLLLLVNHKENKVILQYEVFTCERGQTLRSLKTLSERWNWDKSTVNRFLKLLQSDSMIVLKPLHKTTQITICNYDIYQSARNMDETTMKRDTVQTIMTNNDNKRSLARSSKSEDFEDLSLSLPETEVSEEKPREIEEREILPESKPNPGKEKKRINPQASPSDLMGKSINSNSSTLKENTALAKEKEIKEDRDIHTLVSKLLSHVNDYNRAKSLPVINDSKLWYIDIRGIIKDGYSISNINKVIEYLNVDPEYNGKARVSNASDLRKHFTTLSKRAKDNPIQSESEQEKNYFNKIKQGIKIPSKKDASVNRVPYQPNPVKNISSTDQAIEDVCVKLFKCLNKYLASHNYEIIPAKDVINWDKDINPLLELGNSKDTLIRVINYIEQYSSWIEHIYNANDFRVLYPEILKEMNN